MKYRLWQIVLFSGLILIFSTVVWLSGAGGVLAGYTALLSTALALLLALPDLRRFALRHRQLSDALKSIRVSDEQLPPPENLIEEDYRQLIRALGEEKQRQASAMDLRMSDMQDYFTLWAHQIKTPIAAMRLILQTKPENSAMEIEGELFRVEQYVEMVLNYLRLDSDSTDFVFRTCALDDIIRQCVRKYAKQFIRKRIRLEYEGTALQVLTDEKWLCFVIEQILSNALKYTSAGSIRIFTQGETLVIADTGMGIAPEDLPRVFEKGYTGYNGRTDKKATGIGLYLCKRILNRLGHEISISAQVGKGTRVSIDLSREETVLE
ncbi:MAG: sensor histidine kinase [Candidatus Limivicinus sp.]|nr:sensor histidine kinase [Candidatus Limivicinus sp.]